MENTIEKVVNKLCESLPSAWQIALMIEDGAAWVELMDSSGNPVELPDTADKTITEQLNDALLVANRWMKVGG